MGILSINVFFSTLIFWIAAKIYIIPKLHSTDTKAILIPVLLLHATRHFGLMFLEPGATKAGIPQEFAYPAAYGDFAASILALISIPFVLKNLPGKRWLLWIFNLEGSLDLLVAIGLATYYEASTYMGAAYWIPVFWVPALLVTHYLVFKMLLAGNSHRMS
jgi:hypothetical protein